MKKKISRILGVVLTLVLLSSLAIVSTPVSAGTQSWTTYPTPLQGAAGNLVLDAGNTFTGPMVMDKDGTAIYAASNVGGGGAALVKSTDGGRTWAALTGFTAAIAGTPGTFTDIVCSSIDANTVYVTDGTTIWKSIDGGTTWAPLSSLFTSLGLVTGFGIGGSGYIVSLDVGYLGTSPYIFAGISGFGMGGAGGGAYVCEEAVWGMPWSDLIIGTDRPVPFAALADVTGIRVDPVNFATTQMVMAVVTDRTANVTLISSKYGGAQWDSIVNDVNLPGVANDLYTASLWLPDDFSSSLASGLMQAFVGVDSMTATEGDVFLAVFAVPAVPATAAFDLNVSGIAVGTCVSGLDGIGSAAGASLQAAGSTSLAPTVPRVFRSSPGGFTWLPDTKRPTGGATPFGIGRALPSILVLNSTTALVSTHGADCGVSITNDYCATWNTISLVNTTIGAINDLGWSGSNIFMTTSNLTFGLGGDAFTLTAATDVGDAFTLTAATYGVADEFTITAATYGVGDAFTLTSTAVGTTTVVEGTGTVNVTVTGAGSSASYAAGTWTINFANIGDVATVTATAPGTVTWTDVSAVPTALETVDPNNSMTVGASGVAFAMDMNMTVSLTLAFGGGTYFFTEVGTTPCTYDGINFNFGDIGDMVTIDATTPMNLTWTNVSGTATALETVDPNNSMTVGASGVPFNMDMNMTVTVVEGTGTVTGVVTTEVGNIATTVAYAAGTWTINFGDIGDVVTVTDTAPGTVTWNNVSGTATALETVDPDNSMTVGASGVAFTMDRDIVVSVAGAVSMVVTTEVGTTTTTIVGGVIYFGDIGDVVTVTATADGNVTWTNVGGTATALETYDPDNSMTVGASGVAFAINMNTPSSQSVWRYDSTNWERVLSESLIGAFARLAPVQVEASPASDAVFLADIGATAIWRSTDDGQTWMLQVNNVTSTGLGTGTIGALAVVDANTVVVGDATNANTVYTTTTNGGFWFTRTCNVGTVTSLTRDAGTGDLLAGGLAAGVATVARSQNQGISWTAIAAAVPLGVDTVDTTGDVATNVIVTPSSGYATNDTIFVTGTSTADAVGNDESGVWKYDYSATTPAWSRIDSVGVAASVVNGTGLVAAPATTGVAGAEMVYASDATAGAGVMRIRQPRTVSEQMADAASTFGALGSGANNLWAGSNTLYAIDMAGWRVRTYTDTLNVSGTGVAVSAITTISATVSWTDLANAATYLVVVNTTAQTNFYTAANSAGVAVGVNNALNTAAITGLVPGVAYNVSVWGATPVSSYLFDAAAVPFTTLPAPPVAPANLVPANGAINIPILGPAFAWAPPVGVPGITGYNFELTTDPTFATITVGTANPAVPYLVWGTALEYETAYYWRVQAVTATGVSTWVTSVFTTVAEPEPPVTVEPPLPQPTPTIILPTPTVTVVPPDVEVTVEPPDITVDIPQPTTTIVEPQIEMPEDVTPMYIWAIVAIGALLVIAVIILIIRTRRVV